jgi:dTDP-4-amino-4,6-dideoxygalactose transaminase
MISMTSLVAEHQTITDQLLVAVQRVISSGRYILGDEVQRFEESWAATCKSKYGVGVANGMDAIELILRGFDVGCGDEVITTAMTAFPTVLGILRSGATPVVADIQTENAQLCIESVERCITSRTRAIVLVHLYGFVSGLSQWREFCDARGLLLIEDCAQSHLGVSTDGYTSGSVGDASAHSFYPTKNLGAIGDAGIILTNNRVLADATRSLRNYGQRDRYVHELLGANSRLDEIQAAILNVKLLRLREFTERRTLIAKTYNQQIASKSVAPLFSKECESSHVFHLYVVRTSRRHELIKHLAENNVETLIHYPVPIHKAPAVQGIIRTDPRGLENVEQHAAQCLSIPCHPFLKPDDVHHIIKTINDF